MGGGGGGRVKWKATAAAWMDYVRLLGIFARRLLSIAQQFDALSIVLFSLGLLKSSLICYSFCNNKSNTWARYSAQTVQQTNKIRRVNVIWTMDFLSNLSARLYMIFLIGNFYLWCCCCCVCELGSFSPDFRLICTIRRDVDWNDPICLTDLPFALLLLSCRH